MRSWQKQTLLTTTAALLVAGTSSFAQDADIGTVAQLANVAGGNETAAYRFGLDYSEDLGVSALGNFGLMMGEEAALGFVLRGGENVTEGLLNLGFNLPQNYTLMLSAGVLRENLFVGEEVGREWVRQEEYALGVEGDKFAFNAFLTDSDSTENYVGARSYGAEVSSDFALSDAETLSVNIGYQRIEWKDDSADDEGLTGGLDVTVASDWGVSYGAFADYGVSEAVYGVRAEMPVGNGSLSASYSYVDGLVGAVGDDQRIQIALNFPLGGNEASAVSTSGATSTMPSHRPSLLAQVMTRPSYLPERVIVRAAGTEASSCSDIAETFEAPFALLAEGGSMYSYPNFYALTVRDTSADEWVITQDQITEMKGLLAKGTVELIIDGTTLGEWSFNPSTHIGGREFSGYFFDTYSPFDGAQVSSGTYSVTVNFKTNEGCTVATHNNPSRLFMAPS